MLNILLAHVGNGADGLCDRFWLAYAACLDDDVVEAVELHDVVELLNEIHLERAADASVLQCHKALVLLAHNASLLDEAGININLTNVVDYNGKLDVLFVSENVIYERCFSAAQVAREQQHWSVFHFFIVFFLFAIGTLCKVRAKCQFRQKCHKISSSTALWWPCRMMWWLPIGLVRK